MDRFASARKALAICDVCGFSYKLKELRPLYVKGNNTNVLACPTCWNPDHPQLSLGEFPVNDPQALRNPRPDTAELASSRNNQYGFNPVGLNDPFNLQDNNLIARSSVGSVVVTATSGTSGAINVTGIAATGVVGTVTASPEVNTSITLTGVSSTSGIGAPTISVNTGYTVTVANPGSGNRYYINGALQPTLTLSEGSTYVFNWSAATGHPFRFSTTSDGTHGGGSEYTTGVTIDTSAYTSTIVVASGAPTLYYYCQFHSAMGGQLNTT